MLETGIEMNAEQVYKMFDAFNKRNRKKVFRAAIMKSLNIVKKQTLANLEAVIEPDKITMKDKYGMSFKKGVTTKVYKSAYGGVIHILKNYKMKWFETGTDERYASHFKKKLMKKKRHTGKIKAYHYFQRAKESKQQEVFNTIEQHLKDAIIKINNKFKGKK